MRKTKLGDRRCVRRAVHAAFISCLDPCQRTLQHRDQPPCELCGFSLRQGPRRFALYVGSTDNGDRREPIRLAQDFLSPLLSSSRVNDVQGVNEDREVAAVFGLEPRCVLIEKHGGAWVSCLGPDRSAKVTDGSRGNVRSGPAQQLQQNWLFDPAAPGIKCRNRLGMRRIDAARQPGLTDIPSPFTMTLPCASREMSTPGLTPSST